MIRDAKLKKQEEKRVAKEEIKFVKKKGEKGLKQIFNDQGEGLRDSLGVKKSSMKKGGKVKSVISYTVYNIHFYYSLL